MVVVDHMENAAATVLMLAFMRTSSEHNSRPQVDIRDRVCGLAKYPTRIMRGTEYSLSQNRSLSRTASS